MENLPEKQKRLKEFEEEIAGSQQELEQLKEQNKEYWKYEKLWCTVFLIYNGKEFTPPDPFEDREKWRKEWQ